MCWIWGGGEGYVAAWWRRQALSRYSASIFPRDGRACNRLPRAVHRARYFRERRRANFQDFPRKQFDRVIAVFMVSY